MRLDPQVETRKFDREVELLRRNAARLQTRGVFLGKVQRPEIDLVFVPRAPLQLAPPTPGAGGLLQGGQTIQVIEMVPIVARAFGVRFSLDGYDQQAPSITFRDPWSWDLLPYGLLPLGHVVDANHKGQLVILDGHPITKRPFLCLRGVREYHDHPQHDGDDWAMYRSSTNVFALVERLIRIMFRNARPQLFLALTGGGMGIQLRWAAEDVQ